MMNLKIFKGFERFFDRYPSEAVKYSMDKREEAIPELLEILKYTLSDVEKLCMDENYLIHFPAVYMLAYFRETKAFDYMIKIAFLPEEQVFSLMGDIITEDFGRILASVCDGNIEPIQEIIEDSSLDEYVREQALYSLLILLNIGVVSRDQLVSYFKSLFNGKLEVDYSGVWDSLPRICSSIHPKGLEDDIRKAVADQKVMEILADLDYMEHQLERSVEEVLEELKADESYSLISEEDVYLLETWVGVDFDEELEDEYMEDFDELVDPDFEDTFIKDSDDDETLLDIPIRRENFVGRNDPCPCGSGKKYKKCCGK